MGLQSQTETSMYVAAHAPRLPSHGDLTLVRLALCAWRDLMRRHKTRAADLAIGASRMGEQNEEGQAVRHCQQESPQIPEERGRRGRGRLLRRGAAARLGRRP